MNENLDQEQMKDVAVKTRERVISEIPHLENLVKICSLKHPNTITPLAGVMRSFAIFCESDDNIRLLNFMRELFASYAYAKTKKDSLERRQSKTIIETLQRIYDRISETKKKNQEVDFHFDFYPLIRQYTLLLIRGHKQSNEEREICDNMLAFVGDVAKRTLDAHYATIKTCDELIN